MSDHEMTPPEKLIDNALDAALVMDGDFSGFPGHDISDVHIAACQYLINTGLAWQLQGRIGRACMDRIEAGDCSPMQEVN